MNKCNACPRKCGIDRNKSRVGFCGQSSEIKVSRISLHAFEEPPISGTRGSGTIFFCGCNLKCVFCQNKAISQRDGVYIRLSPDELVDYMLRLEALGAHNINLVTPTHFTEQLIPILASARRKLRIPIVWNSSGYESTVSLKKLRGLVDIYLPDMKYFSSELAEKYSSAPDYPDTAFKALTEMLDQVGAPKFDADGIMTGGVIVRHLVLPSHRQDSIALLERLADTVPVSDIKLSLMSQYTPDFAADCEFQNLHRRLTTFEYRSVLDRATELGFDGYFQELSSADSTYTPDFEHDRGLLDEKYKNDTNG